MYNVGERSFSANIGGLATNYAQEPRQCQWYLGGSYKGQVTIPNGVAAGGAFSFTGLTLGTSYAIRADIYYTGGSVTLNETAATDQAAPVRPGNWSWSSTIARDSPVRLTAGEWNSFCGKINEFREYRGMSRYSFTSVSRGTNISAAIVNQAHSAIDAISGRGGMPAQAARGGVITAEFFNGLRSALNAIP